MLLNLYETKLNMLDNPKKKSKMWISMSEELKAFHIEVCSIPDYFIGECFKFKCKTYIFTRLHQIR